MSSTTVETHREDSDVSKTRMALVENAQSADALTAYLPDNYVVVACVEGLYLIAGYDWRGWTLDEYVIPRLASGLIWAKEVRELDKVIDFLRGMQV
jgi:hypothetical protein